MEARIGVAVREDERERRLRVKGTAMEIERRRNRMEIETPIRRGPSEFGRRRLLPGRLLHDPPPIFAHILLDPGRRSEQIKRAEPVALRRWRPAEPAAALTSNPGQYFINR
ncbi:MAG: hypothetical protein JHC57_04030 [Sphingopyxis sp.]|uniref:hypothetical protein n=1 Tax=Sphingopyxis sp. TaxID=1908224 RepID=UPI001A28E50E|nr:hypothetical protein [Sphingopyxis sp.]MBJ7498906.1 hypothetical protein [Sphingopyxis sp.]